MVAMYYMKVEEININYKLSLYEYFDNIETHLKDMTDYYKSKGEWKIQITMRIIFISFIDKNQTQLMHTKVIMLKS